MKLTVNVDDRIVAIARKTWGIARHRASHFMLAALVLAGVGTIAHATTKKHTFTSGTAALAAQVNENFDDLFAAVSAVEDELQAGRQHSITLSGSTANRSLAISNNGYFYSHPDSSAVDYDPWGQLGVPIPEGSVVTGMTCYVYNNSAIPATDASFTAYLRKTNLSEVGADASVAASMDVWPDQRDEIQSVSASVDNANATLTADSAFILQIGIAFPDTVPAEDYFPDNGCSGTECNRLLRHYGCRIEYESP